jgi:hydroxymethylpyrimidine pyrophosphatase-like HAD family hydrolase
MNLNDTPSGAGSAASLIRHIIADVDGCFTAGGRDRVDLAICEKVRQWNDASPQDPTIPSFSFCTGRPLPYTHALSQFIGCHVPSLAEFGAVLWDPTNQQHLIHPLFTADCRRKYYELLADAEESLLSSNADILLEGGKFCQVTLYPRAPRTMADIREWTQEFVDRWSEDYLVDYTHSVMSFLPRGIHKGSGLLWLAELSGLELAEIAGIGDAVSDWEFLSLCGISATPDNGQPFIRERAKWVMETGPRDCIEELYERVMAHNRAVLAAR